MGQITKANQPLGDLLGVKGIDVIFVQQQVATAPFSLQLFHRGNLLQVMAQKVRWLGQPSSYQAFAQKQISTGTRIDPGIAHLTLFSQTQPIEAEVHVGHGFAALKAPEWCAVVALDHMLGLAFDPARLHRRHHACIHAGGFRNLTGNNPFRCAPGQA